VILGIGIDNVEIKRIKDILMKWVDRVEKRVFNEVELEYSKSKGEPHLHLAARFAAKEAFFKATGKGLNEGMAWTDVTISNDSTGKPDITVSGKAKEITEAMGVQKVHVSLSHTRDCAMAVVILEQ
jgi:holo-[acyl-carrier protein] synthase